MYDDLKLDHPYYSTHSQAVAHLHLRQAELFIKRVLDVSLSFVLLLLLLPLLALVSILIKSASRGPVFFVQDRIGQFGGLFRIIKFRTMYHDLPPAIASKVARLHSSRNQTKHPDDPRITRSGRWLRRASIDELPQLFNVLAGSMSLVGPRALMPETLAPYPDFAVVRNLVRPGITGLWQIHDRESCTDAKFMIKYDVGYICRFS